METAMANMESLIARRLVILSLIGEYTAKGLENCQNVATLKKELAQINFDRYKDKYPAYLFFTDEQFGEVVKRNKLVTSTVEAYTGYIPDECFKAVQNENIDREDLRENRYDIKITSSYSRRGFMLENINFEKLNEIKIMSAFKIIELIEKRKYNGRFFSYKEIKERLYGIDYSELSHYSQDMRERETSLDISATIRKDYSDLYIAGTKSMIDKSRQKRKITEYFKIKRQATKDPIIFRYVKDGILIITFWS
jgi:hypothetical protein